MWQVHFNEQTYTGQVVPMDDLIEHELSEDCICGPMGEIVPRPDGWYGRVITHHSLDGREKNE